MFGRKQGLGTLPYYSRTKVFKLPEIVGEELGPLELDCRTRLTCREGEQSAS